MSILSSSSSSSICTSYFDIESIRNGTHPDYAIYIENGQRILRPIDESFRIDPDYNDVHESEVYLSNLGQNLLEDQIVPFLCQAGPIYQLRIMMTLSGATKGQAYAIYCNVESANRAVRILNGQCIRSNQSLPVKVGFSVNNNRLRVSGIPNMIRSADQLKERLNFIGIRQIQLLFENHYSSNGELEAIIVFHDHSLAASTRRLFIAGIIQIDGHRLTANWDAPKKNDR
ncbi:Heterogeneous nuclear ribonucleoprotein R (RRM superfamily)-like [Euroglyphus maynei]|uniref:Heterogeneous nuclear ribonucleoprotein R (RRM superfamily)-like n=1 Tax=Euroglyphus maynei TaxID=6958 RepID=A0A1Y3APG0_EURMA|nr:Heterogeneous nuclear ribonucleoprotein R (RRM superfamily)-like [Euroglyphus maynei]